MKKMNTRSMVEGAVFASITAILGIMSYYIPLVSLIGIFWAVPIIVMGFRNGFKVSFISAIVAGILVSIFTEPYSGIYLFLVFGISGIVMGNLMNKKINPGLNILISGFILGTCSALGILMSFWLMGQSPAEAVSFFVDSLNESIVRATQIYESFGVPADQIAGISDTLKESIEAFKLTMPAFFLINGLIFSFVNFKATKLILKRMKYEIEDIKSFSKWRVPDNFSIGLLSILLLTIIASYLRIPNIETAAINVMFLLRWIFTIVGLSVAAFYIEKYKMNKVLKYIILVFLFISLSNLLTILGLIDAIFNIRKISFKNGGDVK